MNNKNFIKIRCLSEDEDELNGETNNDK